MFRLRLVMLLVILVVVFDPTEETVTLPTIVVSSTGEGNFTSIQAAIDSVPSNNKNWICIRVKQGTYREQIIIPDDKPFIYLKGDGKRKTYVIWDAHDSLATSATITSKADYIIVKSMSFVNSYNSPGNGNPIMPAVAAMIEGDKSVFHRCGFFGFQDTLWDVQGRHYFKLCTIQGAVDFIFGGGQSLYERSTISVVAGALNGGVGYITAQARSGADEPNGFVFNNCNIIGTGKTYLGRPWRDHARVIFYNTYMLDIIVPQGWDPWYSAGLENQLTFAEHGCRGLGSDTSRRVKWANKLGYPMLRQLTNISFIDTEGWMSQLAVNVLAFR